jgi:hypothetical protein
MKASRRSRGEGERPLRNSRSGPTANDLETAEAFEILRRLSKKRGVVGETVREAIAAAVLEFDGATIAASVHADLDALTVEDLWDRSGPSRYGYVDPADESWVMVEEVLQPYVDRIRQLQRWKLRQQARDYCLAVLDGIDSFDEESSEFKSHAEDDPAEAFGWVHYEWKRGVASDSEVEEFDKLLANRFPERVKAR